MSVPPKKPRAVLAHGIWGRGGAEAVAAWTLVALRERFDLTLVTRGGFDCDALNALAGTDLSPGDLRVLTLPARSRIGTFEAARFNRALAALGRDYDLRVSLSGVRRWNAPALHLLSARDWHPALAGQTGPRAKILRRVIDGPALRPRPDDMVIANSHWLAAASAPLCPGRVRVIPPPVALAASGSPPDWSARREDVLIFGRIAPEKRIERAIAIVARARAQGFHCRLVIAGPDGPPDYMARIRALIAGQNWIERLPPQSGAAKAALLGSLRYGLNCCEVEAFGIATAEMAASGMIPLVPRGTGQDEIVSAPDCRFSGEAEAARCLLALSRDADLQSRLSAALQADVTRFAPARFTAALATAAMDHLSTDPTPQPEFSHDLSPA
ncbi:glycosyltransferase family 4 protein [Thioclava sp. F36-7]|uniref:glycosyltransferase family 4 protein n=1 Tax=Thioclava sp. F36-7 TaxID=1915317 RepID=UPI000997491D|nr:glycosyltransferase family 4 protein [Thioclava sp. F36-7]OOY09576.1 hypothetical protein BMI89_07165 [Thioclava sp. F36-7]